MGEGRKNDGDQVSRPTPKPSLADPQCGKGNMFIPHDLCDPAILRGHARPRVEASRIKSVDSRGWRLGCNQTAL